MPDEDEDCSDKTDAGEENETDSYSDRVAREQSRNQGKRGQSDGIDQPEHEE